MTPMIDVHGGVSFPYPSSGSDDLPDGIPSFAAWSLRISRKPRTGEPVSHVYISQVADSMRLNKALDLDFILYAGSYPRKEACQFVQELREDGFIFLALNTNTDEWMVVHDNPDAGDLPYVYQFNLASSYMQWAHSVIRTTSHICAATWLWGEEQHG
jgi:hypothetical protein